MGDLRPLHQFHLCLSGRGRGLARETIRRIDSVVLDDFEPDLTLILDLDVETGLERAGVAGRRGIPLRKFRPRFP